MGCPIEAKRRLDSESVVDATSLSWSWLEPDESIHVICPDFACLKDGPVMVEVKADVKVNALSFEELFQPRHLVHDVVVGRGTPAPTAAVVPRITN